MIEALSPIGREFEGRACQGHPLHGQYRETVSDPITALLYEEAKIKAFVEDEAGPTKSRLRGQQIRRANGDCGRFKGRGKKWWSASRTFPRGSRSMWLADTSIKRPPATMMVMALVVFGVVSYPHHRRDLFPR
jgi:hypothetical protein